jgi:MFS transporter, FHS family, glucose/mannose:H+ symporter
MPWISFFANGMWLLVIGLMGPSIPSIITELDLGYSSAGLIFTLLSAGALIGSFISGVVSDYLNRKHLWIILTLMLTAGLAAVGLTSRYLALLAAVFLMSLFGGAIGAVGQGIMLQMFPEKRGKYLSLQTLFAAGGSFTAPLLLAVIFAGGGNWRAGFFTAAGLVFMLALGMVFPRIPSHSEKHGPAIRLLKIFSDHAVLLIGSLIFLSVGIDIGFSYWLSEYFVTTVGTSPVFSSIAVSVYLGGVMIGRFSLSRYAHSEKSSMVVISGLLISAIFLLLLLSAQAPWLKLLFSGLYGAGVGPLFPYLMTRGTARYPENSGSVTGVLFAMMSFAGIVFPFVIGVIGTRAGIAGAYYVLIGIELIIFLGIVLMNRAIRPAG